MKKYIIIILALFLASCSDFLDRYPDTSLLEEEAILTPYDAMTASNGLHNTLRNPAYYGKNMQVVGDIAADNLTKKDDKANSVGFINLERYLLSTSETEIGELWAIGYRACDRSARLIKASKKILQDTLLDLTSAEIREMNTYIGQGYAIKALSHFNLVNIFGLPYTGTAQDYINPGIILVRDTSIHHKDTVHRESVGAVYDYILRDLDSAKVYFAKGTIVGRTNTEAYKHFTHSACIALEARVRLYRKEYDLAISAAQRAITLAPGRRFATSATELLGIWQTPTSQFEDIFILTNTVEEDAGTASLAYQYKSHGLGLSTIATDKYEADDWRQEFITRVLSSGSYATLKFYTNTYTNKYPVFRLAEMHLIQAEAYAMRDDLDNARTALLPVAQRNPAITSVSDLPSDKDDLLAFIADERVRELLGEGHRWFDLRRTGALLSRPDGTSLRTLTNYDVSAFCYPIPQSEINASHIEQNDWLGNLP